jgi:hypothetical protein
MEYTFTFQQTQLKPALIITLTIGLRKQPSKDSDI